MDRITKATGHWVPSVVLRIGTAGAETAALLLDSSGRVRGDADLVFHGQPAHPSGAVRLGPAGLALDLNGVEPAVERIVVAGWTRHSAFRALPTLKAVAPDGADIVTYTVAEEAEVSAVALGAFFREADGWKFDGLGQGYGSGLAGLIASYGIEVADADRPTVLSGPVPLTGVVKMPGQAPPEEGAYVPGLYPPPERPYRLLEGWEFGPVFEPFTAEGHGNQVVTVGAGLPSGPVLVEVAHEGEGYFALYPLDERNKDEEYVFAVSLPDLRGSRVVHAPKDRPLRFRVVAENRWILRVKPMAAARRLEGVLHGYGPEILIHPGKGVDLRVDFAGGPGHGGGFVSVRAHEVAGHYRMRLDPSGLLHDSGALRRTVPVMDGPVVMDYYALGPWTLTVKELHSAAAGSSSRL
ncbi:TerD family protein [Streptomyces sp. NPDC045431]|uniref:TerD family protein n=1 Tax=Streptomyces sp. NPDC045431 TaxID=3155613 RepID=UPI0033D762E4